MRISVMTTMLSFCGFLLPTALAASPSCEDRLAIDRVVRSTNELPTGIQNDLREVFENNQAFPGGLGDSNAELYDSDVRDEDDQGKFKIRFRVAHQIGDNWFVSFDRAYPITQPLTFKYALIGAHLSRSPLHVFGGPVCEVLIAAKNGVFTPQKTNYYPPYTSEK